MVSSSFGTMALIWTNTAARDFFIGEAGGAGGML
jgi:hypothetical protein